ncbi:MAG: PHP domain-containing protein [Catenulispora sp.]|nr:PHP domain-containing protein [Catenulispora sp.]
MTKVRAVAHIHSEWSDDASWPLDRLAAAFQRRGRSVLLMCEHSRTFTAAKLAEYVEACAKASTEDVLIVPGLEYNDADNVVHIPVWGDVPFLGQTPDIPAVLTQSREADGVAVFAHPWRRAAWRRFDPSWAKDLTAVEIWNRKYDGWSPNREAVAYAKRLGLPPFVALDFHGARQFFPLAMELTLTGPPSRNTVEDALRAGDFEALAFSRSALRLASGVGGIALATAESARAVAARALRMALRR